MVVLQISISLYLKKLFTGTYSAQEVDLDDRFKFFFMSITTSIDGWKYCLSIISVDGKSFKNKFSDTLLNPYTFDGK